jgi:hypothetical protein
MINYKFEEDRIIGELVEYINSTYSQHYSQGKIQAVEFIIDNGHGEGFLLGNIQKYVGRYGKKEGYNRKDLLKVAHIAILALYNHDQQHSGVNQ